jgi:predicted transcriptional regulator
MKSQVVILMDKLADDDQKAIFMGMLLARIFWYRKLAGMREIFKHLLVMEEFHILADAEKLKGKSRIESLVRTCREFGQGVMIIDQNPGKIADAILGNLNSVISMNLGNSRDINAVGTAMALEPDIKRYLGRLEVGEAICRIKDRLKDPVLVKIDAPEDVRKIEPTPEEILAHNGNFVAFVPQDSDVFKPVLRKEFSHISREDKLTPLHRKILRYLKINYGANLKSTFISQGLSYRRGNGMKKHLESKGLIYSERVSTSTGHETRLYLTDKGHKYLENTEDARRLGGKWHKDAVEVIVKYNEARGFVVRREWKDADVFVDMGSGTKIYEVESLDRSKDYVHAVSNAVKSLLRADLVEVIVKGRVERKKLLQELRNSPARNQLSRIKIKLLKEYNTVIFPEAPPR